MANDDTIIGYAYFPDFSTSSSSTQNFSIGQTLRLQIELGKPERRIIIPRGSFYSQTGGQWIMRVEGNGHQARRVPIKLGRQNVEHYEAFLEALKKTSPVPVCGIQERS